MLPTISLFELRGMLNSLSVVADSCVTTPCTTLWGILSHLGCGLAKVLVRHLKIVLARTWGEFPSHAVTTCKGYSLANSVSRLARKF